MIVKIYKDKPDINIGTITVNNEIYYILVSAGQKVDLEEIYYLKK